MKRFLLTLFSLSLLLTQVSKGFVVSRENKGIPNVQIMKDAKVETVTDSLGYFVLRNYNFLDTLKFSHAQYQKKKIVLKDSSLKYVALEELIVTADAVLVEAKRLLVENYAIPIASTPIRMLDLKQESISLKDQLVVTNNIESKLSITNSSKLELRGGEANETGFLLNNFPLKNFFTNNISSSFFKLKPFFKELSFSEASILNSDGTLFQSGVFNFKPVRNETSQIEANLGLGNFENKSSTVLINQNFDDISVQLSYSKSEQFRENSFAFSQLNKAKYKLFNLSQDELINSNVFYEVTDNSRLQLNYLGMSLRNNFSTEKAKTEKSILAELTYDFLLNEGSQISLSLSNKKSEYKTVQQTNSITSDQQSVGLSYKKNEANVLYSVSLFSSQNSFSVVENDRRFTMKGLVSYNFKNDDFNFVNISGGIDVISSDGYDLMLGYSLGLYIGLDVSNLKNFDYLNFSMNLYKHTSPISNYFLSQLDESKKIASEFSGISFDVSSKYKTHVINFSYYTKRYKNRLYIDYGLLDNYYYLQKLPSINGVKLQWKRQLTPKLKLQLSGEYLTFNNVGYFNNKAKLKLSNSVTFDINEKIQLLTSYQFLNGRVITQQTKQESNQAELLSIEDNHMLSFFANYLISKNLNISFKLLNIFNQKVFTDEEIYIDGLAFFVEGKYVF